MGGVFTYTSLGHALIGIENNLIIGAIIIHLMANCSYTKNYRQIRDPIDQKVPLPEAHCY